MRLIAAADCASSGRCRLPSEASAPGPLVYGERVIVSSRDGKVYWLDRYDGELINAREIDDRPELLGDMLLLQPSDTLVIDEPLLLVTSVHDGRLLIAFGVDGRQTWVYPR